MQSGLPTIGKPLASPHCKGPGGLEGWTLLYEMPDELYHSEDSGNRLPLALVVEKDGHSIRKIDGDPIVWKFVFVDDQKVAIETGPLHFGMSCLLIDLKSGKPLEEENCYDDPPKQPQYGCRLWKMESLVVL